MSEENAGTARRLYEEIMPAGKAEAADGVFTDDFVNHAAPPGSPPGREGARNQVQMLADAFDGQAYEVHHLVADGDTVIVHCTWTAKHTGEFMGIPATQKAIASRQAHILRFDGEGRIAEHWAVRDDLTMLRQMGIAPS